MKSDLKNFIFSFSTLEGLIAVSKQSFWPETSLSFPWLFEDWDCFGFVRLKCLLVLFLGRDGSPTLLPATEILFVNFMLVDAGPVTMIEGCLFVQYHPPLSKGSGTLTLWCSLLRKVVEHLVVFLCFLW